LQKVETLLDKGADANAKITSPEGRVYTVLMVAARKGHCEIVQELLVYLDQEKIDTTNCLGYNALMFAAENGYFNIVKCLVNKGANISIKAFEGNTAHEMAKFKKHKEIAEFLDQEEKQSADKAQKVKEYDFSALIEYELYMVQTENQSKDEE
jgi:ankyrin repeat protein